MRLIIFNVTSFKTFTNCEYDYICEYEYMMWIWLHILSKISETTWRRNVNIFTFQILMIIYPFYIFINYSEKNQGNKINRNVFSKICEQQSSFYFRNFQRNLKNLLLFANSDSCFSKWFLKIYERFPVSGYSLGVALNFCKYSYIRKIVFSFIQNNFILCKKHLLSKC